MSKQLNNFPWFWQRFRSFAVSANWKVVPADVLIKNAGRFLRRRWFLRQKLNGLRIMFSMRTRRTFKYGFFLSNNKRNNESRKNTAEVIRRKFSLVVPSWGVFLFFTTLTKLFYVFKAHMTRFLVSGFIVYVILFFCSLIFFYFVYSCDINL